MSEKHNNQEVFLTGPMVRERYHVTDVTIWRWSHGGAEGFPAPIKISGRKYWKLSELVAWEAGRKSNMGESPHECAA